MLSFAFITVLTRCFDSTGPVTKYSIVATFHELPGYVEKKIVHNSRI